MVLDSEFDHIKPYCGHEVIAATERLCESPEFLTLFSKLTGIDKSSMVAVLKDIRTRDEFQEKFFGPAIKSLIAKTAADLTVSGLECISPDASYIFISNHRDIILDSAILNLLLRTHGAKYTRAAIGSNLLINEWITDLVKLNSCFVIERNVVGREMLISSTLRSKYIRSVIEEGENSVWIAQREGRTKNGDDRTQQSLLKMLKMSGSTDLVENFKQLHLVPLAISYEWEPCDDLKTEELYAKTFGEYTKTPEEDMNSMLSGLSGYKGRIHFHMEKLTDGELDSINDLPSNGERIETLAKIIDSKVHKNFKLWPNNYIAYDLLHSINKYSAFYTEEEKEQFIRTMAAKIDRIQGNTLMLNNIYLEIYANPVKNRLS